jgi:hypothetical protein
VDLVRTDNSEERISPIIRVTRLGDLGTTLAVTSNQNALLADDGHDVPSKRRYLQQPHGVTSQKTTILILETALHHIIQLHKFQLNVMLRINGEANISMKNG